MTRCTFTAIGMVCVLPAGHPSEPVFGGHYLVRHDIVEQEKLCVACGTHPKEPDCNGLCFACDRDEGEI